MILKLKLCLKAEFYQVAHTKAEYMEKGASCVRHSVAFSLLDGPRECKPPK
jgi:hypothetical protein